jgi:hypothetical protein
LLHPKILNIFYQLALFEFGFEFLCVKQDTYHNILDTTKNDTIIPVAKAANVLSINYKVAGADSLPLYIAICFLKFSNKPNLADPKIPTPINGVSVPILKT